MCKYYKSVCELCSVHSSDQPAQILKVFQFNFFFIYTPSL
jgi:hypothetical protein